jgi:hypothetical protein
MFKTHGVGKHEHFGLSFPFVAAGNDQEPKDQGQCIKNLFHRGNKLNDQKLSLKDKHSTNHFSHARAIMHLLASKS